MAGRGSADSLQKLTETVDADGRTESAMNPARSKPLMNL